MSEQAIMTDDIGVIIQDQADRLFNTLVASKTLAEFDCERWPAELWDPIAEAGLPLALAPEDCGGIGLSVAAAGTLIALAGYHAVPLPLGETIVAQSLWARTTGSLLEGSASLAPVNATDRVSVAAAAEGYRLTGKVRSVPWGNQVANILVYAEGADGGRFLILLPGFLTWSTISANLAGEPRADIVLDGIVVPAAHVRPCLLKLASGLLPFGGLLRAFQMVGAMRRALDLSVQYAGERQQFGKPIGKFQAIQQMLAEAAGHLAAAEAACARAAAEWDGADFAFFAGAAKARAGEAAGKVAEICHQAHGAIGFTQEHSLHFFTRRLWSWRDEYGNETYWQSVIGQSVCGAGHADLWPRLAPLT